MSFKLIFSTTADFTQGGLVENVDIEIRLARWNLYDYEGQQAIPALALTADLHEIMKDGSVSEVALTTQHWTAGASAGFTPIEEGRFLASDHDGATLKKGSNFFLMFESLEKQGFALADGDASQFNGLQGHVIRVPAPERTGLDFSDRKNKPTVLIFSALIRNPNEKSAKKGVGMAGKASSATAGKAVAAKAPAGSTSEETKEAAKRIAGDLKDGIKENQTVISFRADMIRTAVKTKVDATIKNELPDYLKSEDGITEVLESIGYMVDGEVLLSLS